jgi:hypothetical protein
MTVGFAIIIAVAFSPAGAVVQKLGRDPMSDHTRRSFLTQVASMGLGPALHSPVAPVIEGRAVATDAPADLLSQVQGTSYAFR